ncbi:hypothetical protein ACUXST_002138 [Sphingomonas sp. F9_3S_D5_B_2]
MLALTKVMAGGVAAAAMFGAAPAAAQYYPYGGTGYGNSVAVGTQAYGNSNGYGYGNGYAGGQQALVSQCTAAVQARLGGGYGYGSPYGSRGGGRVLGISRIEPRQSGGLTIRGVASSSAYSQHPDLTFRCRADYRGYVTSVEIQQAQRVNGYAAPYGGSPYAGSTYGGSPYGYADQSPYDSSPYDSTPYDQGQYDTGPYGYSRY